MGKIEVKNCAAIVIDRSKSSIRTQPVAVLVSNRPGYRENDQVTQRLTLGGRWLDAASIRRAAEAGLAVEAKQLGQSSLLGQPTGLEILYVAGQIDPESRAFKVYVRLPNRTVTPKIYQALAGREGLHKIRVE